MGFFDDAIRQHLDLKRQHGADPREVAHLEREALGSLRDHEAGRGMSEPFDRNAISPTRDVIDWSDGREVEARRLVANEETAEIDMAALIGIGHASSERQQHAYDWSAEEVVVDIGDPASSFEWEMPARSKLRKAA
jgi:hypothetical protein